MECTHTIAKNQMLPYQFMYIIRKKLFQIVQSLRKSKYCRLRCIFLQKVFIICLSEVAIRVYSITGMCGETEPSLFTYLYVFLIPYTENFLENCGCWALATMLALSRSNSQLAQLQSQQLYITTGQIAIIIVTNNYQCLFTFSCIHK